MNIKKFILYSLKLLLCFGTEYSFAENNPSSSENPFKAQTVEQVIAILYNNISIINQSSILRTYRSLHIPMLSKQHVATLKLKNSDPIIGQAAKVAIEINLLKDNISSVMILASGNPTPLVAIFKPTKHLTTIKTNIRMQSNVPNSIILLTEREGKLYKYLVNVKLSSTLSCTGIGYDFSKDISSQKVPNF